MILAGGFTSGREIRRIRTDAKAAPNLNYLVPPTARPWLCGPAFDPCSTGSEPNSGDFLYLGAARFGRIDRRTFGACSRLDVILYACHPRLVNGYLSASQR
jgi:hypothetical protein